MLLRQGNGDYGSNYSRYKAQFAMPGWESSQSLFHSFNLGRMHIVGINTEAIEHSDPGDKAVAARMLEWLEQDMVRDSGMCIVVALVLSPIFKLIVGVGTKSP